MLYIFLKRVANSFYYILFFLKVHIVRFVKKISASFKCMWHILKKISLNFLFIFYGPHNTARRLNTGYELMDFTSMSRNQDLIYDMYTYWPSVHVARFPSQHCYKLIISNKILIGNLKIWLTTYVCTTDSACYRL